MPIHCSGCGYENRLSAAVCGSCGVGLNGRATCPSCDSANPPGQRFCNECGLSLAGGRAAVATEPAPRLAAASLPAPPSNAVPRVVSRRGLLLYAAVALFFAVAAFARLADLGSYPDGVVGSESDVRAAVSDILAGRTVGLWSEAAGGQPTGFVYALAGWGGVFGKSAASLRLMSALLGVAAVAMFFVYCRAAFGARAAVLGGMLLAFSLWHIGYSRLALPLGGLVLLPACRQLSASDGPEVGGPAAEASRWPAPSSERRPTLTTRSTSSPSPWASGGRVSCWPESAPWPSFWADAPPFWPPHWSSRYRTSGPWLPTRTRRGGRLGAVGLSRSAEYIEQPGLMEQWRFAMRRIVSTAAALPLRGDGDARRLLDPATALLAAAGLIAALWRWRSRETFHLWSTLAAASVVVGLTRDDGMYGRLIVALPVVYAAAGYAFDGLLDLMRGRTTTAVSLAAAGLILAAAGAYNVRSYYDAPVGPEDSRWTRASFGTVAAPHASARKRSGAVPGAGRDVETPGHATLEVRVQPRSGRNELSVGRSGASPGLRDGSGARGQGERRCREAHRRPPGRCPGASRHRRGQEEPRQAGPSRGRRAQGRSGQTEVGRLTAALISPKAGSTRKYVMTFRRIRATSGLRSSTPVDGMICRTGFRIGSVIWCKHRAQRVGPRRRDPRHDRPAEDRQVQDQHEQLYEVDPGSCSSCRPQRL